MTINIQYESVPFSEALTEYAIDKLNRLGRSYRVNKAQVLFKRENFITGKGKVCEMILNLAGKVLVASSSKSSYEKALREATEIIERQLITKIAPATDNNLVEV